MNTALSKLVHQQHLISHATGAQGAPADSCHFFRTDHTINYTQNINNLNEPGLFPQMINFSTAVNPPEPLVVMTEAPAVTTRAATILRKLVCIEGGELPHLREDFIGTARRARNGHFLLLRNSLRDVRIRYELTTVAWVTITSTRSGGRGVIVLQVFSNKAFYLRTEYPLAHLRFYLSAP